MLLRGLCFLDRVAFFPDLKRLHYTHFSLKLFYLSLHLCLHLDYPCFPLAQVYTHLNIIQISFLA